jgi:hypothetical protein
VIGRPELIDIVNDSWASDKLPDDCKDYKDGTLMLVDLPLRFHKFLSRDYYIQMLQLSQFGAFLGLY